MQNLDSSRACPLLGALTGRLLDYLSLQAVFSDIVRRSDSFFFSADAPFHRDLYNAVLEHCYEQISL